MKKLYKLKDIMSFTDYLKENTKHSKSIENINMLINIIKYTYNLLPIEILDRSFTSDKSNCKIRFTIFTINEQGIIISQLIEKEMNCDYYTINKINNIIDKTEFNCNNYNSVDTIIKYLLNNNFSIKYNNIEYVIKEYGIDYTFDSNHLEYNKSIKSIKSNECLIKNKILIFDKEYPISIEKIEGVQKFFVFRIYCPM